MHPFTLERPRDLAAALALRAQAGRNDAPAEYIAGGTDMVQLLQEHVRRPERLVSLAGLLDNRIEVGPQGLRARRRRHHGGGRGAPGRGEQFPVIAEALLNSASPQVRNQATIGGNLLQRTRCPYFRDVGYSRLQQARARLRLRRASAARTAGTPCSARASNCIAANASDLAVALVALDAAVELRGARRATHGAARRLPPPARGHPAPRDGARAGRGDRRHRGAGQRGGAALALPQGARPRLLRVRGRVRRGCARDGRRTASGRRASRSAASGPSPGACPRVEAALAGASLDPAALRRGGGARRRRARRAAGTTTSRSNSCSAPSCARSRTAGARA